MEKRRPYISLLSLAIALSMSSSMFILSLLSGCVHALALSCCISFTCDSKSRISSLISFLLIPTMFEKTVLIVTFRYSSLLSPYEAWIFLTLDFISNHWFVTSPSNFFEKQSNNYYYQIFIKYFWGRQQCQSRLDYIFVSRYLGTKVISVSTYWAFEQSDLIIPRRYLA